MLGRIFFLGFRLQVRNWILILFKSFFRQDLQDIQDFFVPHFPEENDETQCARGA